MDMIGFVLAVTLFVIYLVLWRIKRFSQIKKTGIDPEIFGKSDSNLQRYIKQIFNIVTVYVAVIMILHLLNVKFFVFFDRFVPLDSVTTKLIGFIIGLAGLGLCLYAQLKMGNSWRVGIDDNLKTELITGGLYKYIRNPTYTGLFLLNAGIWLIWPTFATFILNIIFVYTLEIQVRCEEDFLEKTHGDTYRKYKKTTKRYIPFLY